MNRRYTHMLCFILALILTVSITPISAAEGDAPSEETQPSDTVSVVVATRDIPIGTRLSGEHITVVEMKNKNIPANTVSDPALLIGKNAHEDIYEGEYVRALQLTDLTVYPINKACELIAYKVAAVIKIFSVNDIVFYSVPAAWLYLTYASSFLGRHNVFSDTGYCNAASAERIKG